MQLCGQSLRHHDELSLQIHCCSYHIIYVELHQLRDSVKFITFRPQQDLRGQVLFFILYLLDYGSFHSFFQLCWAFKLWLNYKRDRRFCTEIYEPSAVSPGETTANMNPKKKEKLRDFYYLSSCWFGYTTSVIRGSSNFLTASTNSNLTQVRFVLVASCAARPACCVLVKTIESENVW